VSRHFRLRRVGRLGGPAPLVLLPGLFVGAALWEGVLAQCTLRERTAYVCEGSFLGMLDAPTAIDELADVLARDLESAGVERSVIVGGSFGGLLAMEFAARCAPSVAFLVLSGAPGFGNDFRLGMRSRSGLTTAGALKIAARIMHDPSQLPDSFVDDVRREMVDPARFLRMLRLLRAASRLHTEDTLRRIVAPAALIWGAHDAVTPLERWLPCLDVGWTVRVIPDAGHAPMLEAPIPFSRALFDSIA
jgi:2-hydroxy-6-oxonona-2,4-dienedioate hydrolase